MKMIPKQTVLKKIKQTLKRNPECELKLLTFKKDRSVRLLQSDEVVTIFEAGYQTREFHDLTPQEAQHLMKKLLVFEFPRSHNVYWEIH